jgi:uncharacterized membrane protein YfcA
METAILVLVGVAAGTLSPIVGVGGGVVIVPALHYLFHVEIKTAVGTSLAVIVPTAIVGVLRTPSERVLWGNGAWLAAGAVGGAWLGAWLARDVVDPTSTKRIFAGVLALLAAYMFWESA